MKTKLIYESPVLLHATAGALRDFLAVSDEITEDLTGIDVFGDAYGSYFS